MLNDGLLLKGSSGFFDALLEPLAAIALLWLMLLLPSKLAQMAMLGAGAVGGGFMARAVSYAAGSQMRDATRQHLPGWAGGERGASDQRGRGSDARLGTRLSAESVLAASKAASGAAPGAARTGVAGLASAPRAGANGTSSASGGSGAGWRQRARGSASARAYSPPPLASRHEAIATAGGLRQPSWRQERFDAEMLEASLREQRQPVSGKQVREALDALPASTQGAVRSLVAGHGPRARQHLAYQALGEWSAEEREAIRTLAAATPEARAQAFSDASGSTSGFGESGDPRPQAAASGSGPSAPSAGGGPGNGTSRVTTRRPQDQAPPEGGGDL
jgi:hypothetical protein